MIKTRKKATTGGLLRRAQAPLLMRRNSPDDFQTPAKGIWPLLPYIKREWIVWECACGKGNLSCELTKHGYRTWSSDIKTGTDFLEGHSSLIAPFDCIITNPPFTLKNEFIARCYDIGKPFALLLPLTALEGKNRQQFWQMGIQILMLDKRLQFETPLGKRSACWFPVAWFTYRMNMPRDINFGNIIEP